MSVPDNLRRSLEYFGLSKKEILIYLTLLREESLDVKTLSEKTGISLAIIYKILNNLEEKTNIITHDVNVSPKKYLAKSPREAFSQLKKKLKKKFRQQADKIIQKIYPIYLSRKIPTKINLYIYQGRNACINTAKSLLDQAKDLIKLYTPHKEIFIPLIEYIIHDEVISSKNIQIVVSDDLMEDREIFNFFKEEKKNWDVSSTKNMIGTFLSINRGEQILHITSPNEQTYQGIYIEDYFFGHYLEKIFAKNKI